MCWIGLILDSNLSYSWLDKTNSNKHLIDKYWCYGYPMNYNYSFTYIEIINNDNNKSCWKNTFNKTLSTPTQICSLPLDFITYWLAQCLFPVLCCFILLVYTSYIFWKSCYHLFIFKHNWLDHEEPTFIVKITAILLPFFGVITCILGILYCILKYRGAKSTHIVPPISSPSDDDPTIYRVGYWIGFTAENIWGCMSPIGYFHVCEPIC